jgi:outer membrane protein, multidrug efflux system
MPLDGPMHRLLATVCIGLLVSGCLMHGVDPDPRPPVKLPDGYVSGDDKDPGRWWTSFSDNELDRLIEHALVENFQLRAAWARFKQAKALERAAAAGLFPNIGGNVTAGRSQTAPRVFQLPGQPQTEVPGVAANNFGLSMPVSYELDVWGRVRAGMLAAEQDTLALRADVEAAAMTITANVSERWFDVLEQRALRQLVQSQIEVNRTNLSLVELRFQQGDAALSDILQQRQQIQTLDAQLAQVMGQETVTEQQLAALVGKSPRNLVSPARVTMPDAPPLPEAGIPATLLERRPDLRAAKARVVAADYRIAQAIANRLPQLVLSGSIGFNAISLGALFESFVWSIQGAINATLWDGGRLDAEIERSRWVLEEQIANYGNTLLNALVEVEGALIQERVGLEQIDILTAQVATANETLEAARRRFTAGIGDYLSVLTAIRSLQQAEQSLLNARRQLLSRRIQVYRALGSRWTQELEAPKESLSGEPMNEKSP